jgi:hypothetical protein
MSGDEVTQGYDITSLAAMAMKKGDKKKFQVGPVAGQARHDVTVKIQLLLWYLVRDDIHATTTLPHLL